MKLIKLMFSAVSMTVAFVTFIVAYTLGVIVLWAMRKWGLV